MRRDAVMSLVGLACASMGISVAHEGEILMPRRPDPRPEPKHHSHAREIARRLKQQERAAAKAKRKAAAQS